LDPIYIRHIYTLVFASRLGLYDTDWRLFWETGRKSMFGDMSDGDACGHMASATSGFGFCSSEVASSKFIPTARRSSEDLL
jgi:hypothetical protein